MAYSFLCKLITFSNARFLNIFKHNWPNFVDFCRLVIWELVFITTVNLILISKLSISDFCVHLASNWACLLYIFVFGSFDRHVSQQIFSKTVQVALVCLVLIAALMSPKSTQVENQSSDSAPKTHCKCILKIRFLFFIYFKNVLNEALSILFWNIFKIYWVSQNKLKTIY